MTCAFNELGNESAKLGGLLDSIGEELDLSGRLTLSHIPGTISISGGPAKATSQQKLLPLLTKTFRER